MAMADIASHATSTSRIFGEAERSGARAKIGNGALAGKRPEGGAQRRAAGAREAERSGARAKVGTGALPEERPEGGAQRRAAGAREAERSGARAKINKWCASRVGWRCAPFNQLFTFHLASASNSCAEVRGFPRSSERLRCRLL